MKAAVVTGRRQFEIRELPTPEVQPTNLLLRVRCCAICGTDLEYVDNPGWDNPDDAQIMKPRESVLGHEWVGEVVEIGKGVEGWSAGDRAVDVRGACGRCYWCQRGLQHLCMGGKVRGTPYDGGSWSSMHGAMAEYVLRGAQGLMKVPDSVTDEEAALTEPLNVGLSPILDSGLKAGDSVAIIGGGHIGLLTMLAAKAAGAAPTILTDIIPSRLEKGLQLGADYALNANEGDVSEQILDITEAGADLVVVCVREADVLEQAIMAVRREGTVAIVGFPKPATLDPIRWLTKHLRVIGCDPGGMYNIRALKLMEYKQVDCRGLITATMPLHDTAKAFDSLYAGENVLAAIAP